MCSWVIPTSLRWSEDQDQEDCSLKMARFMPLLLFVASMSFISHAGIIQKVGSTPLETNGVLTLLQTLVRTEFPKVATHGICSEEPFIKFLFWIGNLTASMDS